MANKLSIYFEFCEPLTGCHSVVLCLHNITTQIFTVSGFEIPIFRASLRKFGPNPSHPQTLLTPTPMFAKTERRVLVS